MTDPRGLATRYSVDGLRQRTRVASPDTGTTASTFDGAGNLASRVDARGQATTYRFDAAGASPGFSYDASGNRTSATFGAATYANTIDAASNRLLRTSGPAPARRNTYDAAGNLAADGTLGYTYGADGRMGGVTGRGPKTGYRYNGLGQRVAKTGPAGVLVHYVYDEQGRLLGEYDRDGRRSRKPYTWATCRWP